MKKTKNIKYSQKKVDQVLHKFKNGEAHTNQIENKVIGGEVLTSTDLSQTQKVSTKVVKKSYPAKRKVFKSK